MNPKAINLQHCKQSSFPLPCCETCESQVEYIPASGTIETLHMTEHCEKAKYSLGKLLVFLAESLGLGCLSGMNGNEHYSEWKRERERRG